MLSGLESYIVIQEITHILVSCLVNMPAELGRLFTFSTILITTYINFRSVRFLGSVFTVALYVCQFVYP